MTTRANLPTPLRPVSTSGRLAVRVRYCECDPMGVAHHAAYIPWLEMARTELLRDSGVSYAELEAAGVFLVIVKLEVSYKRPAYYDDLVEIRTRIVVGQQPSRVKIRHEYEVYRSADTARIATSNGQGSPVIGEERAIGAIAQRRTPGELLLTGSSLLACVDRQGRPAALPDWLIASE